jgi:phosphatidylserine/phosphatidylglycerophosphate/cardiolipin synthase-like enzyme
MLVRIANAPLSDEDRDECRLIEALLRDRIRGRSLASPEVEQAARLARQRGVQVDILDNRGTELPDAVRQQAVQALTKVLLESRSGVVRVRALPAESDVAVTILASTQDSPLPEFFLEIREPLPIVTRTGAP